MARNILAWLSAESRLMEWDHPLYNGERYTDAVLFQFCRRIWKACNQMNIHPASPA